MAARQESSDSGDFVMQAADLLHRVRVASFATVTAEGVPHVALVTPALLPDGAILLLLSELSAHTRHLRENPACSLLLVGEATSENLQTAPRITLSGQAAPETDAAAAGIFLKAHPYAALYAGFADFSYWRVNVVRAQYVGGFAAAATLDLAALRRQIFALGRAAAG